MSEEKKKVKDLAAELNVTTKEVIAAAKELGIASAKVGASSVSALEAGRLRAHFAPAEPEKQQVIVRRRQRKPVEASASESLDDKASPQTAPTPEQGEENAAEARESSPGAAATAAPAEEGASSATPPVVEAKTPKPASARIVRLPGQPDPERPAAEAQGTAGSLPEEKTADAAGVSEASPAAASPLSVEPKEDSSTMMDTETRASVESEPVHMPAQAPADGKEDEEKQEKAAAEAEKAVSPQKTLARVVRPAAYSAEPERDADGQALSSAPVLAPRGDGGGDGEGDAAAVSTTQARIISRPSPSQVDRQRAAREQPGGRPQDAKGGYRPPRPAGQDAGRGGGFPRPAGGGAPFAPASPEGEQGRKKRQKGRRTVDFTDNRGGKAGDDFSVWSKTASRRGRQRKQRDASAGAGTQPIKAAKRKIKVDELIRVADLAHQMGLKSSEIIKVLFSLGVMSTINQSLDIDTATLVAGEFGYEIEKTGFSEQDIIEAQEEHFEENPADYVTRPPVVTIMGHVDHGKTSLLDAIRKSSVVTGEAGGITQHIGAYYVKTKKGEIVFLDTPGHEAFTAMRARGAEITDIVVLVVAADDGVMEQTKEAINHARAAKVPIMVAVNKMDKPTANPDRVKRELAEQGLVAEDWGGDTTFNYVSAKTREGLDELLELLALQAEILELKANPSRPAFGHIIEAKLDKGRGSLGTVLIQQGTLRVGDTFVCGVHSGRVRSMFNDHGKKVKEAGPSFPVEVQGFEGVPEAGEEFIAIADEKSARRIAEARALKQRERELAKESKITLETFLARKADSVEAEVLNLVIKADVQGTLEAINDALLKLSTDQVRINLVHGGAGAISESDVLLATASNAIIIGFNVRPTAKARELAELEKVDIRFYDIIYKLVEEIRSAMEGMLAPVSREVALGVADVRETFSVPKVGLIAGCHVSEGKITRNAHVRLLRDGVVVHTGKIGSLRRFKDDVREVAKGYECGIGLENFNDVKLNDVIEAFEIVEEAATL